MIFVRCYRNGGVYRDRRAEAHAVPTGVLGGHTAVPHAAADHAVAVGPVDGGDEVDQHEHAGDPAEHDGLSHDADHDAAVREPADGGAVGGQGVGAVGAADHGPGAEAAAQPAGVVLEREQEQGDVLQERELREVPEHLRAGVQQRVLAVAAHVQRVVPPVQRVLRRAQVQPHRAGGAHTGHDQPDRADGAHALPVLVRRPPAAGDRQDDGVQVHMVQEVGQLQAGHLPAVPGRVPAAQVAPSHGTRVRVAGGERVRPGHQQPARGLRPACRQEGLCGVRQGPGLPVRGPVRPAGRVDRAAARAGRRQDILLPAAGAPEHQQGARALRGQGHGARATAHVARRPAQRARVPAPVPDQEGEPQAAERADTVQRLPVPQPVLVQLHRAAGHRRGDHADQVAHMEGAHGRGAGQGAGQAQRDAGLVQRAQRVLPRRPDTHARLVQDRAQVHAHAAARVPQPELHEAQPVRQVLPQPGARAHAAQSLPAGVPQPGMHVVPHRDGGRAPAALPGGLRQDAEEDVHRVPAEQRDGHDHLEVQETAHIQGVQHSVVPRFLPHHLTQSTTVQINNNCNNSKVLE